MTRGGADHASAQKKGTSTSGKAKGKRSGKGAKRQNKYGESDGGFLSSSQAS